MNEESTNEAKTPGPTNRQGLYAYASKYSQEAIDVMVDILRTSRNESLKLGAAKALLDKALPDLKAMEVTGENGEPIKFNVLAPASYFSAIGKLDASSTVSTAYGPATVQSTDLAQTGEENNNGDKSVSSVESA